VKNAKEADRQKQEAKRQEAKAKDQTKKAFEAVSRGNVLLARYSKESGNAEALARLAQALRAESGKSGSVWLDGCYADTIKLAHSPDQFNEA
jgi:hypothetical protein